MESDHDDTRLKRGGPGNSFGVKLAIALSVIASLVCIGAIMHQQGEIAQLQSRIAILENPDRVAEVVRAKRIEVDNYLAVGEPGKGVVFLAPGDLSISNKADVHVLRLMSTEDAGGSLYVCNPVGKSTVSVQGNKGVVHVFDTTTGKLNVFIGGGGGEGTGGTLDVFNPLGKRVISVQANKANNGIVYVYDMNGVNLNMLAPVQ